MDKQTISAERLPERVRRTLDDLAEIRQSLLAATAKTDHPTSPPDSLLDLALASELKSVVDELRTLLWAYIHALSVKSGRQPEEVLEWYKMELAVGMLRHARAPENRSPQPQVPNGYSFENLITEALAITAEHVRPQ